MTDVSHELGALRFVVESPLSSKVAMFNNQATQHKQSQLLNPFSHDGRASSPKPTFSKDQYGKPLAGSLTEMRGQKANMHVMKEMLELCQIIDSEGYAVKDEPSMRVIPFGELFNIYNYISDKVVGILLRARKHKLLEFEGEMLYQRRDDDVPIFLLRPIVQIRRELTEKIDEIKRGASPAPQSTSVMLDRTAHENNLKVLQQKQRLSKSRTPSPAMKGKSKSKSPSPAVADKPEATAIATAPANAAVASDSQTSVAVAAPVVIVDQPPAEEPPVAAEVTTAPAATATEQVQPASDVQPEAVPAVTVPEAVSDAASAAVAPTDAASAAVAPTDAAARANAAEPAENTSPADAVPAAHHVHQLPTIVIEASATFVRTVSVEQLPEEQLETAAATAESV